MTVDDDARRVLARAAEVLSEHGWVQGVLEHQGSYCALGAIRVAAVEVLDDVPSRRIGRIHAINAAEDLLEERLAARAGWSTGWGTVPTHNYSLIGTWNDHPDRTVEDVILTLKRAAHE